MADQPQGWTWYGMGWGRPESIPRDMPDRKEHEPQTVIYGPDGKTPLIVRSPRPLGFRPERAR